VTNADSEPRWGLRTLAFLGLATLSILLGHILYVEGVTAFVLLTFLGMVIGLGGAVVCSVRGVIAGRQQIRDLLGIIRSRR
jgi:hypothetical protein